MNKEKTKIILDTDMGSDSDDAGALALLHHLLDNNRWYVEIMWWQKVHKSAPKRQWNVIRALIFKTKSILNHRKKKSVVTYLNHKEGYVLKHTLTHSDKSSRFVINTEFINNSEKDVEIDMLWFMTENKGIPVAAGGGDNACAAEAKTAYGKKCWAEYLTSR